MFAEELNTLKQVLEANISLLSGNVEIIERGTDQRIKGITDSIPNYAYIDYQDGAEQIILERQASGAGPTGAYFAAGNYKLVARLEGLTANSAINLIFACLANDKKIEIETITQDAEFIFAQEFEDEHEITCNMALYLFEFTITKIVYNTKVCVDIICKDNSC